MANKIYTTIEGRTMEIVPLIGTYEHRCLLTLTVEDWGMLQDEFGSHYEMEHLTTPTVIFLDHIANEIKAFFSLMEDVPLKADDKISIPFDSVAGWYIYHELEDLEKDAGAWTFEPQPQLDNLFGNGSGEELYEYATEKGLSPDDANKLLQLLRFIDNDI